MRGNLLLLTLRWIVLACNTHTNDVAKVQGNATFAPGDVVAALPVGLDELAMFECVH